MYISEINIKDYKGFKGDNNLIEFTNGINVLIGQNNAGKTTVIDALRLLFDKDMNKNLKIDDFCKNHEINSFIDKAPEIVISARLVESDNEDDYSEDLVTVSTWLNKIEKPYEATITYKFFLPSKEQESSYKVIMKNKKFEDINDYWEMLEYNFLRKYTWKIYVGNPEHQVTVDQESLRKFDFQFVDAIRDVQRDLVSGKNALLKEIIYFFMDYDIKTDKEKDLEAREKNIEEKRREFSKKSIELIKSLQERMHKGKDEILKYVKATGASIGNNKPDFEGKIVDTELYSALRLIVEDKTGIKLPVTQNGLGYNNLIYMSLLLAKMQKNSSSEYLGENAKIYSILAIEEPEAHLHPNMQYKFLKFLNENKSHEVRQVFITSHSANITAAVDLENIIILDRDDEHKIQVAYPGKVFDNNTDKKSKDYIKRFLDVTKADMFFARRIILVEGIAEQLLIPEFAKKIGVDLIDKHISVINVGGRYFSHFLKLFDTKVNKNAINKKVVCITDLDPTRVEKKGKDNEEKDGPSQACYPLFLNCDTNKYKYNPCSNQLVGKFKDSQNIKVISQEKGKSSTFEYDIILSNPTLQELVTDSVSNADEIKNMMNYLEEHLNCEETIDIDEVINLIKRESKFKEELIEYKDKIIFDKKECLKQIIASRYLMSIKKGTVAQELISVIIEEINKGDKSKLKVPPYIEEAITWICQ